MANFVSSQKTVTPQNTYSARTANHLAQLKAYHDTLEAQYQALIISAEEVTYEYFDVKVSDATKYEMLVSCCYALDKLSYVVEHWESAQREDEYKDIRIWNLMACIAHAWDIATTYASDEASEIRHAIKKIIKIYNLPFDTDKDVNKYIARV